MSARTAAAPAPVAGPLAGQPARAGRLAQEAGVVTCLWLRELLRLRRERARWAGAVGQPILFWLIMGLGMSRAFRIPGAEHVSSLEFFFPGMLVMIVLFSTIFTTISLVEDRQQGFLQSVLVAPGSRASLVVGKVAGVTSLTLLQCALFLLLAPLAGFSLGSISWGTLVAVVVVATVGLTGMNFCVAWIFDSVQGYHAIMSVVLIPLWFLSGAIFPRPDGWFGAVMLANPLTWTVEGVRGALSVDAAGPARMPVSACLAVLAAYALAMLALATWTCRRK